MNKRQEILKVIEDQIENKNIIKHMLAVEACMKALAKKLKVKSEKCKIDEEIWGLAGLSHDLDYQPDISEEEHGTRVGQILEQEGITLSDEVLHTIAAHNWRKNGVKPKTKMDWALYSVDSLTGLIVAAALVMDGKLDNVSPENVLNRFEEKNFAAGCRRDDIKKCDELGFSLEEFVEVNLKAMQDISDKLGL